MPSGGYNRRDELAINSGAFRNLIFVYQPRKGVDDEGGVIRDPAGVGQAIGGTQPPDSAKLWQDRCSIDPYGLQERTDLRAPVSEELFTIATRWARNKRYIPGLLIYMPSTQESFTILGSKVVLAKFQKWEMICRRVN